MKKLYKSGTQKKIAGVCGGIAEYFDLDPTLIRLAVLALCLVGGGGVLAYIAAAIVMPEAPVNGQEYTRDTGYSREMTGQAMRKEMGSVQQFDDAEPVSTVVPENQVEAEPACPVLKYTERE